MARVSTVGTVGAMARWWWLVVLASCGFSRPSGDAGVEAQVYCGTTRWDLALTLAEVGAFNDTPRLGPSCLRMFPGSGTFELVEDIADQGATARGLCRFTGTLASTTATVTDGECRYDNGSREGRLFDLKGTFTFVPGGDLTLRLDGKVEEVGSVRRLVGGVWVEREGFPQAITGSATVRYETKFEVRTLPSLADAGVPQPACPSERTGCWQTAWTSTVVVGAGEAECVTEAAQLPAAQVEVIDGGIVGLESVARVTKCSVVGDQGNAVLPAAFSSLEVDFSDGGVPALNAWRIVDVARGAGVVRCEVAFSGTAAPCP